MSDATLTALVAGFVALLASIPPTLLAWAALNSSKRNADKADTIINKSEQIHALTNSNLSKVTTALEVANTKIEGLQKLVTEMVATKNQAQEVAMKPVTAAQEVTKT